MAEPSKSFVVRLNLYGIDAATLACKPALLPVVSAIVPIAVARSHAETPKIVTAFRASYDKHGAAAAKIDCAETIKLFANPFDDRWEAACLARAEGERAFGWDSRYRAALSCQILSMLIPEIGRRHRWNGRKVAMLSAAATRIFQLDTALAFACHTDLANAAARQAADETARAVAGFNDVIAGIHASVSAVASDLAATSTAFARISSDVLDRAEHASAAAASSSSQIGSTAAATEELSASIAHISAQASDSARLTEQAVHETELTHHSIQGLEETVQKIGSFVGMIAEIAGQTNLLALNATIEAARAGETGRGFAVVAGEVKQLATQTAKATDEISQQIALVQAAAVRSVDATRATAAVIGQISHLSGAVSASVASQGQATNDIARSSTEAVRHSREATDLLSGIHGASQEIRATAERMGRIAAELEKNDHALADAARQIEAMSSRMSKVNDLALTR
jgi:methyl-accepting chemotaxis protein